MDPEGSLTDHSPPVNNDKKEAAIVTIEKEAQEMNQNTENLEVKENERSKEKTVVDMISKGDEGNKEAGESSISSKSVMKVVENLESEWREVSMEKAGRSPKVQVQEVLTTPSRYEALSNADENGIELNGGKCGRKTERE
ncbi:hypothetical protein Rs2_26917 [Raphanus sativus]|nr:hypothetical protein Rs2_26917 [Raphanus sativus]